MIRNNLMRGRALVASTVVAAIAIAGCGGSSSPSPNTQTHSSRTIGNLRAVVTTPAGHATATRKPQGDAVLGSIHAKRPSSSHPVPHLAGFDESSITTFAHEVDGSVGAFWQTQLNQAGYSYSPVSEDLINQPAPPARTGCSGKLQWNTNTQNAMYCSLDNTIYLPTGFLASLGHNYGDAAVAVVIAHENGHHLQQLLGITPRYIAGQFHSIQIELQADCLAGVWMSSEYQRGDIQQGDLQHALVLFNDVVGDPRGYSPLAPDAHGSGAQRWASFLQGYNSGQGGQCEIPALPTHE